jgi:tRNA-modifying protein YgfZ
VKSPLLAEPGAVEADGPDVGLASHYGDPYAEQRAITRGWGVVDTSNRGVVRISGADRLSWLHSLTTQHLESLQPEASAEALVLSPQGHIEHHLVLTDDGEATWAYVEPGTAQALIQFLTSMKFMLRVEAQDVTAEYAVLTLLGPAVPTGHIGPAIRLDTAGGTHIIVGRQALAETVAAVRADGAALAGMWAHEALRIAAGRPRFGLDTDHRTIPHEVGWIGSAVHLDKGCYRGQETVARVHNIGHPPRRLVLLHLDGSENRLPAHGEAVVMGGAAAAAAAGQTAAAGPAGDAGLAGDAAADAEAGQATDAGAGGDVGAGGDAAAIGFTGSAARHYELGPIALALVKRTTPVTATLETAGIAAAQEVIVPPDAGGKVQAELKRFRAGGLVGRARG